MPGKRYLMAPGPTPAPPEVLAAGAQPVLHHRGPDFRALMKRCLDRLQEVARTRNDVLVFTASGSGAFESAVVNLLSPGERVLVVTAGEFGDRWAAMAGVYGADVHELRYAWGETPQPDDLRTRLEEAGAEVVFLVHSETSTGVVADVQALAAAAREGGALSVVDAVSSLGAVPIETDAWDLDVVVAGSQKALMTPPGLSLTTVWPAARARRRWASSSSRRTRSARRSSPRSSHRPAWMRERSCSRSATASGSPSPVRTATWDRRCCASGTSATTTCSTSRRRSLHSRRCSSSTARTSSAASLSRARSRRTAKPSVSNPTRLRVLVREPIAESGLELLRERFEVVEDFDSELAAIIGDFDAIVVRSATTLDAPLIERATRLKVIGRAGVGVDNVDVDAATRRGIVVANAPEATVVSAAEHTIALLLAVARNIPQAHAALVAGNWERARFAGVERSGKVGGAALDVFESEPYSGPLLELEQVVLTPHLAGSTTEAQDRAGLIIAEQVAAAL